MKKLFYFSLVYLFFLTNCQRKTNEFPDSLVDKNPFDTDYMVLVQGGTFQMGIATCTTCAIEVQTVHTVTLNSYYIGKTEVTQSQWDVVMGSNPSYLKGDNLPVVRVSWNDVQTFIQKLNQQTKTDYRLPTEAEWEFAARGGNSSKGFNYSGSNTIAEVAWYGINCNKTIHPVTYRFANELGLYDMSGNAAEWCSDWYDKYPSAAQTNPTGPTSGTRRVNRGGSWLTDGRSCLVDFRNSSDHEYFGSGMGFRLALSL